MRLCSTAGSQRTQTLDHECPRTYGYWSIPLSHHGRRKIKSYLGPRIQFDRVQPQPKLDSVDMKDDECEKTKGIEQPTYDAKRMLPVLRLKKMLSVARTTGDLSQGKSLRRKLRENE
ncbi:hypothetical protein RB195_017974 [Necator americanus]|uniref:Uncharacterized protein n=1 Tax=Necator americanus TaxID=51031 RepID=A0ABR1CAJ2_NECAM